MRAALHELGPPRVDLTEPGLDLGYSSHSHFTANFRRVFGAPPSAVRGRLAPGHNGHPKGADAVA